MSTMEREATIGTPSEARAGRRDISGRGELWLAWVRANALAEWLGLGGAALIGWLTLGWVEALSDVAMAVVVSAFVFGLIEGGVVGWFQHRVLKWPLPFLTRSSWVTATVVGGVIAWLAASTAVTVAGMGGAASAVEPTPGLQMVVAAGLGAAAGPVLGVPQALVFRRWLGGRAWHWVWANSAAWAAGMPVVFLGAGFPGEGSGVLVVAAAASATLIAAGAIVGAIHGLVMVWLLGARLQESAYPHRVLDGLSNFDSGWQETEDE